MFSPTSGDALISGHSIREDLSEARKSLGLCPQHNMLFGDLTPFEHFMIFAMVGS
jgi:ATP-binding cassette subfamily A (ABC1) protein 3